MLLRELLLGDPLPHRTRTTHPTRDHLEQIIHVICSTPLLVRNDIAAAFHLRLLDQLAIRAHASLRELA